MKIINCDEEVLSNLSNIMELVYSVFGDNDLAVFATLEGKNLGFIVRNGEKCMFINHEGKYTMFSVDENEELYAVGKKDYSVVFDSALCFVGNSKESSLVINELSQPDEDDYTGVVRFLQYDRETDTMCEINYQQMYREHNGRAPIYSFHTKLIDRAYIDEQYSKRKERPGLLPRRARYFSKTAFEEGEIGYDISAIKDYGLVEFLSKGSYNLIREREVVKYTKAFARGFDGSLRDPWPFGRQYTEGDVKEIIGQYGFATEIPDDFLRIYNGEDQTVEMVKELVRLMKELKPELEKEENHNKLMILRMEK